MVSELIEDRFMEEVLDVFGVVEGSRRSRGLGCFLLVARFARVDSFIDA